MIVDAPATGHGLGLLRAPRTFARRRAGRADPPPGADHRRASCATPTLTGVVAVALAEEMPVNETIELEARLRDEMGVELDRDRA